MSLVYEESQHPNRVVILCLPVGRLSGTVAAQLFPSAQTAIVPGVSHNVHFFPYPTLPLGFLMVVPDLPLMGPWGETKPTSRQKEPHLVS